MGILKDFKKKRAEERGYKQIVAKRVAQARRQAYADEAIKVARERAKAKARQPSLGQRFSSYAKKKMSAPRRTVGRTATKRRTTQRQSAGPMTLDQAIYG